MNKKIFNMNRNKLENMNNKIYNNNNRIIGHKIKKKFKINIFY